MMTEIKFWVNYPFKKATHARDQKQAQIVKFTIRRGTLFGVYNL